MRVAAWVWIAFSALVLALLGSGAITRYVQAFWQPALAVCSVLVMTTCGYVLWTGRRDTAAVAAPAPQPASAPRIGLLVLVPVLLVVLVAPSPLGAAMLETTQRVVVVAAAEPSRVPGAAAGGGSGYVDYPQLSATTPTAIGLDELSERLQNGDPAQLAGRPVTFVGFTSADSRVTGGDQRAGLLAVNRFKIYCCAADAIAYTALVRTARSYPADTWLRVTGTVDVDAGSGHLVVDPTRIQRVAAPEVPYL